MKILTRFILTIIISFLLRGYGFAQQLPQISFYRHNWSQINPAAFPREYIELRDMTLFTNINSRLQRYRVEQSAPRSVDARGEYVFGNNFYTDNKLALNFHNDQAGAIQSTKLQLGYAWITSLNTRKFDIGFLSLGGSVEYNNTRIKTGDVLWQPPLSNLENLSNNFVNFNIGGFYYFGQGMAQKDDETFRNQVEKKPYKTPYGFVGVSWSQVKAIGDMDFLQQKGHTNLIVGGVLRRFEPTLWLRWSPGLEVQSWNINLPFVANFNVRYIYKMDLNYGRKMAGNQFWLGGGVSSAATMNVELGYRGWLNKSASKVSKPNYYQVAIAYTGWRLSSSAIPQPSDIELNLSWNFKK
jgi:Type IX secretion system membrane protein PorP/SprF